jgi:AmmeMemoRadiSam system protein B
MGTTATSALAPVRRPAVAGAFYPAEREELTTLVTRLLEEADRTARPERPGAGPPLGVLVPHAGLSYSGLVAAAGWSRLGSLDPGPTVVVLGTNHVAGWLDGIGVWDGGSWRTPLGDIPIDRDLAAEIVALGHPFTIDYAAHDGEHSIEVQLPFIRTVAPTARIVPLAVAAGTGSDAVTAGGRLGQLLAGHRGDQPILLAISSDMAHYPTAGTCSATTETLLPPILALDAPELARMETAVRLSGTHGLVCGMCGIEPTVLGLAALRAMSATAGRRLAAATSADAGGGWDRTVGYLAVEFDA